MSATSPRTEGKNVLITEHPNFISIDQKGLITKVLPYFCIQGFEFSQSLELLYKTEGDTVSVDLEEEDIIVLRTFLEEAYTRLENMEESNDTEA